MNKDVDFLRESFGLLTQMLMEVEIEQRVGAKKHEWSEDRSNYCNGSRNRSWETRVGEHILVVAVQQQIG